MPKFSVKKPLTVFVAVLAILVLGVVAYLKMTPDLMPNMDFPYVILVTTDPGASPETVEADITKPLEQSMATLDRIKNVTSSSMDSVSMVVLEFEDGVNMDTVSVDIQQKINQLKGSWSDTVGDPYVLKMNPSMLPVQVAALSYDGKDITEFARGDLRKEFGMVLQDTWLYSGTIMENIRYGRLDATDEEVIQAAKAAQVDHFVRTLPDGYNTILNEEATNVSQGQKQLLTIARAILSDSRIMILDEATSSVDTRTELSIQTAMDNLMRGRTSFIIAHRLSTIKNCDRILYISNKGIAESGSHDELMEQKGHYYQLYTAQLEE